MSNYFKRKDPTEDDNHDKDSSKSQVVEPKSIHPKQRGQYLKFTAREKAEMAKYASENGISRATKH